MTWHRERAFAASAVAWDAEQPASTWQEATYSWDAGASRPERQCARRERSVAHAGNDARCVASETTQSAREAGTAREVPARRARIVRECILVMWLRLKRNHAKCYRGRVRLSRTASDGSRDGRSRRQSWWIEMIEEASIAEEGS